MSEIEELTYEDQVNTNKIYILKTNELCKGVIILFGGLPGSPADPEMNMKFKTQLFGTTVPIYSSSIGNSIFQENGYHFVTFNYPGLWKTPGIFTVQNSIEIGKKIIKRVNEKFPDLPIFIYGISYGSGIALNSIASFNFIKKVFLRSPIVIPMQDMSDEVIKGFNELYTDLQKQGLFIAKEEFFDVWTKKSDKFFWEMDLKKHLKRIKSENLPVQVIIGKNDGLLPVQEVQSMYQDYTKFELWEDLAHINYSMEIETKIRKTIISYYNSSMTE